jgi:phosphoserine/homoserine phosphotransferase
LIIATDLEGVWIPEIWQEAARVTGLADLGATTHDEPDFGKLMARRVELLQRNDIRLPVLQRIANDILPYSGATELLAWARTKAQVMIVSDSFHELSEGLVQRMGGYSLFANVFKTDEEGRILGYRLRIRGRKDNVVRSLKEIGFHIVAIGDGWNDEQMFHIANDAILFRAPDALTERVPGGHRATEYEDLRRLLREIHQRATRGAYQPV